MKTLFFAIALFVIALDSHAGKYPREAVPQVSVDGGYGSAVVIQPGLVLTARHMEGTGMKIGERAMTFVGAPKQADEEDVDVAAYRVPGIECPCAELAETDALLDEPVVLVGWPYTFPTVTKGESQGVMKIPQINAVRLVTTAPAGPGFSGGGMFVMRDGRWQLVGILAEGGGPHSLAIPVSVIRKWLEGRE